MYEHTTYASLKSFEFSSEQSYELTERQHIILFHHACAFITKNKSLKMMINYKLKTKKRKKNAN